MQHTESPILGIRSAAISLQRPSLVSLTVPNTWIEYERPHLWRGLAAACQPGSKAAMALMLTQPGKPRGPPTCIISHNTHRRRPRGCLLSHFPELFSHRTSITRPPSPLVGRNPAADGAAEEVTTDDELNRKAALCIFLAAACCFRVTKTKRQYKDSKGFLNPDTRR